jgi:Autotransporter beta-domain.
MIRKLASLAVMSVFIFMAAKAVSYANVVISSGTTYAIGSSTNAQNSNQITHANPSGTNGGGAYYVRGVINVTGNTVFENNVASGSIVALNGGAIYLDAYYGGGNGTINFDTSGGNIRFSSNTLYHTTWTVTEEHDKYTFNDIYAVNGTTINMTGTNTLTISSGIASDVRAYVNHASGTVIIGNNAGYQGTYVQTLGVSDISGGVNGNARYYIGDDATSYISGNIAAGAVMDNQGTLTYGSGTNSSNITGNGDLFIRNNVTNSGTIAQKTLTVLNSSTFSTTFAGIRDVNTTNNFITNLGTLQITGSGNVNKNIIGSGNMVIAGNTTNNSSFTITQHRLTVNSGYSFTTNANYLQLDNLVNNGRLAITGGTLNENMSGVATSSTIFTNTVTLSGNNTALNGAMILSSGTLNITDGLNLTSGILRFYGNADLNVNGSVAIIKNNIFSNNGDINVHFAGTGAFTGNLDSADDINVNSVSDMHISGNASAANDINVNSGGETNISGDMTAANNINIDSGAETNISGDMYAENDIDIYSNDKTFISGNMSAESDIAVLSFGDLFVSGDVVADENIMLTAAMSNSEISGDVSAGSDLIITSGYDSDITGNLSAQRDVVVNAEKFAISGNMNSSNGDIHVVNQDDSSISGNITAAGNFVKEGIGHVVFDKNMVNNYTDTIIHDGSVAGNYGNLMGNILNDGMQYGIGSVEFYDEASSAQTVFNKDVIIRGDFSKTGDAVFNVVSSTFAAGSVTLDAGVILANTYMDITNDINVNDGTIFGGTGTVKADNLYINNGGTLSAGNSIGTLNVDGNVVFSSGSNNYVEIEQSDIFYGVGSRSDKVAVTNGSVVIHEGTKLEVNNMEGRYFVHEKYDIITTNPHDLDGVFNSPATVTGYDAFRITTNVTYVDGKAVLGVERIRTNYANDVYGLTHNQRQTAKGVDGVSTGYGGDLVNALLTIEDYHYYAANPLRPNHAALAKAMDDLSGSVYANSLMMPYFNAKKDRIYDRMYIKDVKHKEHKENCNCYDCSHNLWIEYSGSYNTVDSNYNSKDFNSTSHGVLVGYDRTSVISNLIAGVFAGYSSVELSQESNARDDDKITSDAVTVGVYGGKIGSRWDFSGVLSGSYFDNDAERSIAFMSRKAESSYSQTNVALDLKAAYKATVSSKVKISPFAGFLTNYTMQDEIKEDGAGALNLKVDSQEMLNLEARLGVAVKVQYSKFGWYVSAAASRMLTDGYGSIDASLIDGDSFNYSDASFKDIRSADRGQTFFDYSLGADYKITNKWTVFANLLGDLGDNTSGYYGSLGVMYKW